jgi:hypothetical protein
MNIQGKPIHAVGQASRLSLTSSPSGLAKGMLSSSRAHLLVRLGKEDGDRRDACPTRWAAPSHTFATAWIRLRDNQISPILNAN